MSYVAEKEFIHFFLRGGELIERRFLSDPDMWPKHGRLYAMASDPVAVERCSAEALRDKTDRSKEAQEAWQKWFDTADPWPGATEPVKVLVDKIPAASRPKLRPPIMMPRSRRVP